MSERGLAVYCTGDENYCLPSIVALESVRRHHPNASYFYVADSSRLSQRCLEALRAHEIGLVNLSDAGVARDPSDRWPTEAFWKLRGPRIFMERGFEYSLCIDGDVLCVRPLDLRDILPQVAHFAAIVAGRPRSRVFGDPRALRQALNLSDRDMNGPFPNTGVVLWRNAAIVEARLWERCVEWHRRLDNLPSGEYMFSGDQALFGLVSILPPRLHWHVLSQSYNYRVRHPRPDSPALPASTVRIFHYIDHKPWNPVPVVASLEDPWMVAYRSRWQAFARRTLGLDPRLGLGNRKGLDGARAWLVYALNRYVERVSAETRQAETPLCKLLRTLGRIAR